MLGVLLVMTVLAHLPWVVLGLVLWLVLRSRWRHHAGPWGHGYRRDAARGGPGDPAPRLARCRRPADDAGERPPSPRRRTRVGGVTTPPPSGPSFGLGQDHLDLRDWVHTFAADVVRPAAAEWDEREEFPWPVLEEAARIGLYSLDFFATQSFDETGLGHPDHDGGAVLG